MLNSLNSSNLTTLSLNQNRLDPEGISTFFAKLSAPRLTELHLSTCGISASTAESIAAYLKSPRSRNLESLELNGNELGARGVRRIVDVIEYSNYTIKQVGLFANDVGGSVGIGGAAINEQDDLTAPDAGANGVSEGDAEARQRSQDERRQDESILSYNVSQRLPPLLERNRTLTRRIRRATFKALPKARILLHARRPTERETAVRVIEDVGARRSDGSVFRLLDLPREVLYTIVRHCSGDAGAFSSSQFAGLVKNVEEEKSLDKLGSAVRERVRRAKWGEEDRAEWEVKEEWLRRGGWDKWELERKAGVGVDGDGEEGKMVGRWVKLTL